MAEPTAPHAAPGESRRDFLTILTAAAGAVAAGAILWPVIDALNPDASASDAAHLIVNVSDIAEGTAKTVQWGGLPITIRKLSSAEIAANQDELVIPDNLPDPANFASRVNAGYPSFVVVVGLNTATPCVLEGDAASDPRGDFNGWVCPCDGSEYDPLGRVRKGPATRNLAIPHYTFINPAQIRLG
ncbi:MAG TPA: ubiquinol-cytochrome c reductase iron-sulfur subunit [Acidocella sp.]|nr:ubiquinol-cytochrome c reductase iron-sulfur subunit [Acidocella sp.]